MTEPLILWPDEGPLQRALQTLPYPPVFATLSGAHLYGFPSADSDFDVRGAHLLPLSEVISLCHDRRTETVSAMVHQGGAEVEIVTHDIAKYCTLLAKRNGYVLEQVMSPLVIHHTPWLDILRDLVPILVSRQHAYHYARFARHEYEHIQRAPTIKRILYTHRVIRTGIYLMRTGQVEANLSRLLALVEPSPVVEDLLERKRAGGEREAATADDITRFKADYPCLVALLEQAQRESPLPEVVHPLPRLDAVVQAIRLGKPYAPNFHADSS